MKRETRKITGGLWETVCTVDLGLVGYESADAAMETLEAGLKELAAEGVQREDITFEVDTETFYDGETAVTLTWVGARPATTGEIENAKRTVTLAEHQREARLRQELAEIEKRKAEKR